MSERDFMAEVRREREAEQRAASFRNVPQDIALALLDAEDRIRALEAATTGETGAWAWEAKYKAAREVIGELCNGKRRWTMSVPARPDHDPDLVICDALDTMRRALLGTTEGHRNNVATVKWIAQQFCDDFGNPKADMPQWAHDVTDILVLGQTPVAHPRGRVGVTEAMVEVSAICMSDAWHEGEIAWADLNENVKTTFRTMAREGE